MGSPSTWTTVYDHALHDRGRDAFGVQHPHTGAHAENGRHIHGQVDLNGL